ncbi:MAG TPA: valine--tRNA ligase [Candidatus Saccharimonadales bacterium]|nr:valine--tRNA ligase [Candidatus Saccharimonadales bacterium]
MDKSYDRKKVEEKWYSFWDEQGYFKADPNSDKPKYSLLIPPPNLTGELHLGHAMQHSILDALARYKRMSGHDVLLLPGVDHAGIQFEAAFEKKLSKEGLSKQKLGREEWLKKAWGFKEEVYTSVSKTWRFLGLSADWSREVFTLDEGPRKAVFEEFKTYFDKDLIYKGPYIVVWCPKDQTAIEDVEVEYEERAEKLYYLKYGPLTLATARPETKFGDTAVAVHPDDKRFQEYVGKEIEIETLSGKKKMQVIADTAVDPKFGTGVIKVTPGHDFTDYEIGQRHNLPIIQVIDKTGRLTEVAGKYAGMKVAEAREAMLPELREKGILVKEEDYTHNVAVCERCKSVVEPIISEEWFVKVREMAKEAVQLIKEDEITFLPKNYEKILVEWLENIHDWCISRSLWWGHRIPVWYKDKEMKVSQDSPGEGWVQDEQVLDTWFSSGLWPFSTLGWPEKSTELEKYFPWDFEISAPEIKYLWIARMVMLSKYFTDQVPFKTMFFHGMLRDLEGRKFSKSLGNGIDPNYLIENWGVDATRMALYSYSVPGRDGRVSKQILDERGKNFRNFETKLRNIAHYVIELKPEGSNEKLDFKNEDDAWIKKELETTINNVSANIDSLNLHLATEEIYNFVWHKLADVYLEKTKERRAEAQPILEYVLESSLKLLHPFMPFVTEELWQSLPNKKGESITISLWPKNP